MVQSAPVIDDSQAHAIIWKENATIDVLQGRVILVRVYGEKGLVFGVEINTH